MDRIDVLCAGQASYDLVYSVPRHPDPDEKMTAYGFVGCGGGPAANAAVTVARLGFKAAFAGYLGYDVFGQFHLQEFVKENVVTEYISRGTVSTPLSAILVKPDGKRTVVNYKGHLDQAAKINIRLKAIRPKVILLDGHAPQLSKMLVAHARKLGVVTVLDAGSVHDGTLEMVDQVDYVVASEKFSRDFTRERDPFRAAEKFKRFVPSAIITLGEAGIVWINEKGAGRMDAFAVDAVDSTGAGDAFHGAFAAGLSVDMGWLELLEYASAVGALTCTGYGARPSIPTAVEVDQFLKKKIKIDR